MSITSRAQALIVPKPLKRDPPHLVRWCQKLEQQPNFTERRLQERNNYRRYGPRHIPQAYRRHGIESWLERHLPAHMPLFYCCMTAGFVFIANKVLPHLWAALTH